MTNQSSLTIANSILPGHQLFDSSYLVRMLNLKPHTIYRMCKNRQIEHYRIGKLLYFSQEQIDAYLERCRVKPNFRNGSAVRRPIRPI